MKKFLQTKLMHCSLLLIAIFCLLPSVRVQAQPGLGDYPSQFSNEIFATEESRLVASITEDNDSLVTVQVFMIGNSLADIVEFAIYYSPTKLKLVDKTLTNEIPIQITSGGIFAQEVLGSAIELDMKLKSVQSPLEWFPQYCQHREAEAGTFTNMYYASSIDTMRLFQGGVYLNTANPYNSRANKVNPDSGRIFTAYKFYFIKRVPGPLTNADIGLGNNNTLLVSANTYCYWAYEDTQIEYAINHTAAGPGGGPGAPKSYQEPWRFNFRSPSFVTADSIPDITITETTARLYGTFGRAYGDDIYETNNLLSGFLNLSPTNIIAPGSIQNEGILRYDTVVNYGYLYTTAKNVNITTKEFCDTLYVNTGGTICKIPLLAAGSGSFSCNGETFYYVLQPAGVNTSRIIPTTDIELTGLDPVTKYYAWAVMEYKFETSVPFYAIDDFEFITKGDISCDPVVEIGSIFSEEDALCGQLGSFEFYASGGSGEYQYQVNGTGTLYTYEAPHFGLVKDLPAGTYWVEVYDVNKPDCPAAVSSTINIMGSNDISVNVAVTNAADCNSKGSLTATVVDGIGTFDYTLTLLGEGTVSTVTGGGDTQPFINLKPGTYTISVVDHGNNCSAYSTNTIGISGSTPDFGIQISDQQLAGCGADTGSFALTVTNVDTFTYQLDARPYQYSVKNQTEILYGLSAGTHTLTVWDTCGNKQTVEFEIGSADANPFTADVQVIHELVDCKGIVTLGHIIVTVDGDNTFTYDYSYDEENSWHKMASLTDTIKNLGHGKYTIHLRSISSNEQDTCTSYVLRDIEIERIVPEVLNINNIIAAKNPSACGEEDGVIQLYVTGGSGAYLFRVNGAGAFKAYPGDSIPNLGAGVYYVDVLDYQQQTCDTIQSNNVTLYNENSNLQVDVEVVNPSGCLMSDGRLYATVTGGTGSSSIYQLLRNGVVFEDGNTTGIFNNIPAGLYVVVVTNGACAAASQAVRINSNDIEDAITLSITGRTHLTQCNVNTGAAQILIAPNAFYHYQLDGHAEETITGGTLSLNGLSAGTHTLEVWSDCFATDIEIKIENAGPNGLAFTATPTPELFDCHGDLSKGFIALNVTGGVDDFYYRIDSAAWLPLANKIDTLKDMPTGTYTIDVKDGNNCIYTVHQIEIERIVPKDLNINDIYADVNPTACGATNGVIQLYVTGGSGNYLFRVNGAGDFKTYPGDRIPNLSAGTYYVEVIDFQQKTCDTVRSNDITLYNENSKLQVSVEVVNASDCIAADGELYATASGSTASSPVYIYKLFKDGVQQGADNNDGIFNVGYPTGVYVVTVTEGGCLVSSGEVTINSRNITDAIQLDATITNITQCGISQGAATITITPTTGTYNYQLDGGATGVTGGTLIINDLSAGEHKLYVWSDNFCAEAELAIVVENDVTHGLALTATATPELFDCHGNMSKGFIALHVTDGTPNYQYRIDDAWLPLLAIDTLEMPVGTYTIDVRDAKGCTYTVHQIEIERIVPKDLNINDIYADVNPTTCGATDGVIQLYVTGGSGNYLFSLNGGSFETYPGDRITGLGAGNYYVEVMDFQQQDCGSVRSNDITLYNGDSDLQVSVEVLNASGCSISDGKIYATATGGSENYSYTLRSAGMTSETNNSGIFETGYPAGVYVVDVTDGTCLVSSGEVTINSNANTDAITLSITGTTHITTCGVNQGAVTIAITPVGANYQFDGGAAGVASGSTLAFDNLSAGDHKLYVWTNNYCAEAEITITIENSVADGLALTATATPELLDCHGNLSKGFIALNVTEGATDLQYRIDDEWLPLLAIDTLEMPVGTYTIDVRNGEGCTYTVHQIEIERIVSKDLNINDIYADVTPAGCGATDGVIQLYVTGGSGNYLFRVNGAGNFTTYPGDRITDLSAGTYYVEVMDFQQQDCGSVRSNDITLYNGASKMQVAVEVLNATDCITSTGAFYATASGITPAPTYTYELFQDGLLKETNTDGNFEGYAAGKYVINVTAGTCLVSSGEVTINSNANTDAITLSITGTTHITTCGVNQGAVTIAITPVGANYQFDGGAAGVATTGALTFDNLSAGEHKLYVWTNNFCAEAELPIIIENNVTGGLALTATATPELLDCNGNLSTGFIALNITDGTPNYQYRIDDEWLPLLAIDTLEMPVGTYTIDVRDSKGCTYTVHQIEIERIVSKDLKINDIYADVTPTGCGETDGVIQLYVTGGSGNYLFSLNGGSFEAYPGDRITGLLAGTYYVEVMDFQQQDCGSVRSNDITLYNDNSKMQVAVEVLNATDCTNPTGAFYATASGITPAPTYYSYTLFQDGTPIANNTTGNFEGYPVGKYIIDVTAGGCLVSSGEVTINSNANTDAITLSITGTTHITTCGVNQGAVTIAITPVGANYQFDGGAAGIASGSTLTFDNLSAGEHKLYVWTNNFCAEAELPIIIENNVTGGLALTATATPELLDCSGNLSKGFIALHVTDGTPNYQYRIDDEWLPLSAIDTLEMPVGTYTIDVRDGKGCTYTVHQIEIERIVSKDLNINDIYADVTPTGCGAPDGAIQLYVTGGSGNYLFSLNGGSFEAYPGDRITGLLAGTYYVEVMDFQQQDCGSVRSNDITLYNNNSELQVAVEVFNASDCIEENGALYATASGITPAPTYTYTLSQDGTTIANNNTGNFVGYPAGKYVIDVTAVGCLVSSGEVTINSSNPAVAIQLAANITPVTKCGVGEGAATIAIAPAGTYNYQFDGGAAGVVTTGTLTFDNLSAGEHKLYVWSNNFCTEAELAIVVENDVTGNGLALTATATPELLDCNGNLSTGFIALNVTEGTPNYEYRIDDEWLPLSAIDTLEMPVGTYTIDVRNDEGCTYTVHQIEIERIVPKDLNIGTAYVVTNPDCNNNNGAIQVYATGGSGVYLYSADGVNYTLDGLITNLTAGTYRIYVKDFQQQTCPPAISDDIILENKNTDLTLTVTSEDAISCNSTGKLMVSVSGGNGGSLTFSLTDGSGTTTHPASLPGTLTLIPGVYVVSVTENDPDHCTASSGEVRISSGASDLEILSITTTNNAVCGAATGTADVTVSKATYNYQLNSGAIVTATESTLNFTNLSAGKHVLRVWDNCGEVIDTITVENGGSNSLAFAFKATDETEGCAGALIPGQIALTISGGDPAYQYRINDGVWNAIPSGNVIPNLTVGVYKVEVNDSKGCTYTVNNINIKHVEPEILQVTSLFAATNPSCGNTDGAIQVFATGGSGNYEYSYDGGINYDPASLIDNLGAGTYTIYVRDALQTNCPPAVSQSIILYDSTNLRMTVEVTPADNCGDNSGSIMVTIAGGNGNYLYALDGGAYTPISGSTFTIPGKSTGVYVINVKDNSSSCVASSGEIRITSTNPADALVVTPQLPVQQTTCGSSTGAATYSVTQSSLYYCYQLDGQPIDTVSDGSDIHLTSLQAGTHILRVWNECNEVKETLVITNDPSGLSASAVAFDEKLDCAGTLTPGSITLTISNGTPDYKYSYIPGTWETFTANVVTIDHLTPGNYVIEVEDNLHCTYVVNQVQVDRILDEVTPVAPTATTPQIFCPGATVANLVPNGDHINWYYPAGTLLDPTTALTNEAIYYVTQTVGTCESEATAVKVILQDTIIPAPEIIAVQTFCPPVYIANIATDGNPNIIWFDAPTDGNQLYDSELLVNGGTYYAALSGGGVCVSVSRTPVHIILGDEVDAPDSIPTPQYFCEGALISDINVHNNDKIIWYDAPSGGNQYTNPATTYLVDGRTYYAAQDGGSCESEERTPVQIFLDTVPPPHALAVQPFCDGVAGKTLADFAITGAHIQWYDAATGDPISSTTPIVLKKRYWATQTLGTCESDTIPVQATDECYRVFGTVFPFVYNAYPAFDDQFATYATLYPAPANSIGISPVLFSLMTTPVAPPYKLVLYDGIGKNYIKGTPKFPGNSALLNNPGLPIRWTAFLGYTVVGTPSPFLADSAYMPLPFIGAYHFDGVAKGTYILEIKRAGYLTRWSKIVVTGDTYLGHREILGGDGIGDLSILPNDYSGANSRKNQTWGSPQYLSVYDVNGDGVIDDNDLKIIKTNYGATYMIYEDTYNWLFYNATTIIPQP